jgi:hypothetical protein
VAASEYEDPAKVRRLLLRAAKHTAEAERLARIADVVRVDPSPERPAIPAGMIPGRVEEAS